MIELDGSEGEGGGQILRTALGLSVATGRPFRIRRIRAGRARPGLLRQHLAAVRVATALGRAEVEGAALGSTALLFRPRGLVPGEHEVAVGSAGSAMLVVQTALPAMLVAEAPSRLVVEGGTHNPSAPPFDFFARAFLPQLARMGACVRATLERPGFYPAGGGRVVVELEPAKLHPLVLEERGEPRGLRARAIVAAIPARVGHRELTVLQDRFDLSREALYFEEVERPLGPGNVVMLDAEFERITEVFSGFGERGVPAEVVAGRVADEAQAWLAGGWPVGEHLADQLLVPMALAGGGRFRAGPPSSHFTTNAAVVRRFVDVEVDVEDGLVVMVPRGAITPPTSPPPRSRPP